MFANFFRLGFVGRLIDLFFLYFSAFQFGLPLFKSDLSFLNLDITFNTSTSGLFCLCYKFFLLALPRLLERRRQAESGMG